MSKLPEYTKPRIGKNGKRYPSPVERFWAKVDKDGPDGCWLWTGCKLPLGYGRISLYGETVYAHRFSYELANGAIPEGFDIDHRCRNPACVRPDHLEAVTHRENVMRGNVPGAKAQRTGHCKRGHTFTEDNTYVRKDGSRQCLACRRMLLQSPEYKTAQRETKRRWRAKNREAYNEYHRRWKAKNKDAINARRRAEYKAAKVASCK